MLRFYGPVNPMGSCQARSVYLTTRSLGRLSPLSGYPVLCTIFRQKLQLPFLNQWKGEIDRRKIFHDQSPRKKVADLGGGQTRNLLVSSQTHIQLSHPKPALTVLMFKIFTVSSFYLSCSKRKGVFVQYLIHRYFC